MLSAVPEHVGDVRYSAVRGRRASDAAPNKRPATGTLANGFNVFPREVEEKIHAHPSVGMVAVVGAPDSRSEGKRLVAFIMPRTGEMAG
jgi:hypothetical protein